MGASAVTGSPALPKMPTHNVRHLEQGRVAGNHTIVPVAPTPAPAALAHGDDNLALARLVFRQPPVNPLSGQVLRSDVAAEVSAVYLGGASFAADAQRLGAGGHRLARFVRQHNAILYGKPRSREKASMLLSLTSLQNPVMTIR
jgi:hypothetical protein